MTLTANVEKSLVMIWAVRAANFDVVCDKQGASDNNVFRDCMVVMTTGDCANAAGAKFDMTYFDSDNGADYVATTKYIDDFPASFNDAAAHDNKVYSCEYYGPKRYFKITFTATGAPSTPCSFTLLLGHPERAPVHIEEST